MTDSPFVSVIILNYNGAQYLPACLNALRAQTYPEDCFEVIVSDNGSKDGSLELLQRDYPWVRVLDNKENLGFAEGNNVAIQAAQGDTIILLNNDAVPLPDWLRQMVKAAQGDLQAGMVTGHLQLFYDQLILELESETFTPPGDGRELGIQIFAADSGVQKGVVQYLEGFHGRERNPNGEYFRWTGGRARLGIPIPPGSSDWTIKFRLAAPRPEAGPVHFRISAEGAHIFEGKLSGSEPTDCLVNIPASSRDDARPLVQNAGAIIFRDGGGRDRGTYVKNFEVFYEIDQGQYDKAEEVFAGCGASLLLQRSMLNEIGPFDDDFFMYYEDIDLAWRARLGGWKILYAPEAIARHIHCGTSEEWSPFFLYHVERNRLAMVFKNGAPRQVVWTWGKYLGRVMLDLWIFLWAFIRRRSNWRDLMHWTGIHMRVIRTLFQWLPSLWQKRKKIQASRSLSPAELQGWFVE
jgi:GT2 family glycosyltransferase